jgi:hypothetical protein
MRSTLRRTTIHLLAIVAVTTSVLPGSPATAAQPAMLAQTTTVCAIAPDGSSVNRYSNRDTD